MDNALKMNLSPYLAGKYFKSTKQSTLRHHEANKAKRCLEAERDRVLGALCSLWSKKKLSVEKRQQTHHLSNQENEKSFEDYADRETTGSRKCVEEAATAIMQAQYEMRNAEKAQLTTRMPGKWFNELLNSIEDSLSDLASSDDEEDGYDKEDEEDA